VDSTGPVKVTPSYRQPAGERDSVEAAQTNPSTMIVGTWLCHAINVKHSASFTMNFTADGNVVLESKTRKDYGQWILQDGLPYVQWDNWIKVTSITPRHMFFTDKIGIRYFGIKQGVLGDNEGKASDAPKIDVVTVEEYFSNVSKYNGQRVTVYGKVSHAVRGIDRRDFYILEGKLRCEFRQSLHCTEGDTRETGCYVYITGTGSGQRHVTVVPDLVECECPVSGLCIQRWTNER